MTTVIDHDGLWKDIIEEFFDDFLLFFAKDLYECVDLSKGYDFLEKELTTLFHDSESGKRHVDKLAKVYLKDGEEKWILIHVDVQGYEDKDFPKRMFQYFYRVYDKYDQRIFAIAIFSDDSQNYKPQSYKYSFYGTKLAYEYNIYKILEQNEDELIQSDNPFAMVVLAALYGIRSKKDDNARYNFKYNLTKMLINEKWSKDKINRLFLFIDGVMQLPEVLARKFDTELKELTKRGESHMALTWENSQTYQIRLKRQVEEAVEETIEEAKKEAKKEAQKEALVKRIRIQLCKKFKLDGLPNEINQKIEVARLSNLESIMDNIFDIESLEEVAKYLE